MLRERNFRLFFSGYSPSLFGSAMVPVALSFAVLNEGRGADAIGYVLAAETVPLVALLLLGGVIADRFSRRFTMLGADVRPVRQRGNAGRRPAHSAARRCGSFMALAAVLGAGQAFFNPAMTGLLPDMVSRERLQQANALRGIANSAGSVLGPSLAGRDRGRSAGRAGRSRSTPPPTR